MSIKNIEFETPLRNMLEVINHVKDDGTRKVLRLELKAKCEKIIEDFPDEYQPSERIKQMEAKDGR